MTLSPVDGEEVAAETEGEVHDRRRRRAQAPAEAVTIVRRQLGGKRLEVVPCQRLAGRDLDAGRLEGVGVGEHDVRLHQRRCGDDRPIGVGDGLPDAFGDVGYQLLAEIRREVGEIALLGEAHDVGGLVVDDVGRGTAGELGDELVVDVFPAALAQLDLDVRIGFVPCGDDGVGRGDRRLLEGEALERERDALAGGARRCRGCDRRGGECRDADARGDGPGSCSCHVLLLVLGCRVFHPLTAPLSRPDVSRRWITAKKARLGIAASSEAAASWPRCDLALGTDEVGEREWQRLALGRLDQHEGEEELVP